MSGLKQCWLALAVGVAVAAVGCRAIDPVDPDDSTADEGDGTSAHVDDESLADLLFPPARELECFAPDRDEYKESHGIDPAWSEGDAGVYIDALTAEQLEGMRHTVLFVFDKSGSMAESWGGASKWAVAGDVMVQSVEAYQQYLSAGAVFFPTSGACAVDPITAAGQILFQGGASYLEEWESSLELYHPIGGTPLLRGLAQAHEALVLGCEAGVLDRPIKVALLTDGEPNCFFVEETALAYVALWLEHGIETNVIGLPGSEPAHELLDRLAAAGGTTVVIPDPGDAGVDDFEDEMGAICE